MKLSPTSSAPVGTTAAVVFRRVLPLSALLIATACEPLACQNRVLDDIAKINVNDNVIVPPKCVGANTDFEGDVDITNLAQLESLRGCERVQGVIFIHDSDDIVDVGALGALERIDDGYFLALNNSALANVNLPNLTTLDGGFGAIDNPELTAALLPQLPLLSGDLTLRNNAKLSQLNFAKVARIENNDDSGDIGNVILADLPALTSIDGAFEVLQTIEGQFDVHGTGLTSFKGLETLQEILNQGGANQPRTVFRFDNLNPGFSVGIDFDDKFNIVANGNPNLENFDGLQNLDTVANDIFIGFNENLENFEGLDNLATVNGDLYVVGNASLQNFLGLDGDGNGDGQDDGLSVINGSFFAGLFADRFNNPIAGGNVDLVNFDGLDQLTTINGDFIIGFNTSLEDLGGLDAFTSLAGDLTFLGMEQIDTLSGAPLLTTVGGDLNFGQVRRTDGKIFDPDEDDVEKQLKDINGVKKNPGVKFNPDAGDNGFDALTTVNGNLIFAFSDFTDYQLTNSDNDDLTTVGGTLFVYGNANPDTLSGIETINSLGGLVINFAQDFFGDLLPFENDGLADFSDLAVTNLGAGGLVLGFDDDVDDAAVASLPDFNTIQGSVILARVLNQNNLGPDDLADLNINNIGGDLVICGIRNGNQNPINADLGNLETLNFAPVAGNTTVGGDVIVSFCSQLTNTAMAIATVGGTLEFTALPEVEVINGMNQLAQVGELLIHDMPAVENVNLPGLTNVDGNLELVSNPALVNFDFNLTDVGGNLRVVDCGEIDDIDGFDTLDTVGGDLEIIDCNGLQSTSGLDDLDSVGGTLRLRRLNNITNQAQLNGNQDLSFAALTQVGGLELTQMNNLEDLAGFDTLTTVEGTLTLQKNLKLETLFGLQGLTNIGRKIAILDNPVLALAFFDDDNLDRVEDFDNQNGVNNEPEDPDNVFEAGLIGNRGGVKFVLGDPEIDNGVVIGGQRGIVEVRNNPNLDQEDFLDEFVGELDDFEGLQLFCGNDGSDDVVDEAARFTSTVDCADAQDGLEFGGGAAESEEPPEE